MTPAVPPPRRSGTPYRIGLVCLGNICRSAMAEVVLTERLATAGLADEVEVVSAGTGDWHVGKPMDRRAAALLTAHGYDASRHRAQQFDIDWFEECDLILAMDSQNREDLESLGVDRDEPERLRMFRDFDPRAGVDSADRAGGADGADRADVDVPDPYYGGDDGFEIVLALINRTCDELVSALARERVG